MKFFRELLAVLRVNLSSVPQRIGSALTILVGVTCAVGALVSMLAMGTGAREQQVANVRPDRVILTTKGTRPGQGNITKEEAAVILGLPGVRRNAAGVPIVVFQSMVPIEGRRRATGNRIYFPLVGVTAALRDYAPELHFTAGRPFQSGLSELVASNACTRQFVGFELGDKRLLRGGDWTVVGHFDQGLAQDCIVYADAATLMSAFTRTTYSSAALMLRSPADFDMLRAAVTSDPRLRLEVRGEKEAIEEAFKPLNAILNFVSYFVGTIMAIGATLGAVNSLYAMVDARQREIATLRAIGFKSGPVILAVLIESMLLALPGALLGSVLAWLLFNGLAASPLGYSFELSVTVSLALLGIEWALAMGLLGGLLPALRAARLPVVTALRAI
ncbi:ABC transporter permease [Steroidobacter flavus]|uniref:ABC transporter permease n=1 Tax=Steroidobacter flavus TaxID=1842136 RepID=A0ABV8SM62_9GAMM